MSDFHNIASPAEALDFFPPIRQGEGPATVGVCVECFAVVLTEHKVQHAAWHGRTTDVERDET